MNECPSLDALTSPHLEIYCIDIAFLSQLHRPIHAVEGVTLLSRSTGAIHGAGVLTLSVLRWQLRPLASHLTIIAINQYHNRNAIKLYAVKIQNKHSLLAHRFNALKKKIRNHRTQ